MDDEERFERLNELIDEINTLAETHVILVEGLKDISALKAVGVDGDFHCVQSSGGPLRASEFVWRTGKSALILTDWDRRGDNLAQTMRSNLTSLGVRYDDHIRSEMAYLCRPYAKDVESLDSVYRNLQKSIMG